MRRLDVIALVAFAVTVALLPLRAQAVDEPSKYPDLRGKWELIGSHRWEEGGRRAPLTPEYRKVYEANLAAMAAGYPGDMASWYCLPQGMPMMMSLYDPMEMIVTPEVTYILISHVNDSYRRIYTDGRGWPAEGEYELTFAGYSIGKWIDEDGDGKYDVLEIETRFLKNPRGYDTTGIPFHADGKTAIKERIYLDKADPNVLWNEITVIDNALTRPYSKKQRAERNPDPHPTWKSDSCSEYNAQVLIGTDNYYLSADGKLMPARKDQPPPDLSYFKRTR